MEKLIQTGLEDISNCFGIEGGLYKYYEAGVLKNENLLQMLKARNEMQDWQKETPLGGPGTSLNGICLFCLISHYRLQYIVETGVSGGFYTGFLLEGLIFPLLEQRHSQLTSIELSTDRKKIGNLLPKIYTESRMKPFGPSGSAYWNLILGHNSLEVLRAKDESKVRRTQLYCHDSLHTLKHMTQELMEFKKCSLDRFFIFFDDQNSEMFWQRCLQTGAFKKPGYNVKYISGNESRLNGHLGGFVKYERA